MTLLAFFLGLVASRNYLEPRDPTTWLILATVVLMFVWEVWLWIH